MPIVPDQLLCHYAGQVRELKPDDGLAWIHLDAVAVSTNKQLWINLNSPAISCPGEETMIGIRSRGDNLFEADLKRLTRAGKRLMLGPRTADDLAADGDYAQATGGIVYQ